MDDISVVFDAINSMYKSEDRKKRKEATNYLEDFQKLVSDYFYYYIIKLLI